ncbi:DNA repair XRCC2-like protein isoform X1 isoform A [Chlorella sorokiniana]|uniref:DNA repair XRCC2-like protein isoform X1 isoform A n=1 Tax=Chlorella sorokiniana TaxID=3076 RepID=A0A2P6TZ67_CHLSO|nr:DNA repair XRCC2-like protein isoform X1 isoform A [Chlorella sorokiniana]|eukprot:PRW59359.1 DNA repair XRCC2-like protein isoform X1 isoform A [Chlorella sorokiniana]
MEAEPQWDALADYEEQILQWLQPDETAGQLLRRTYVQPLRTGLPLIDRFTTLRGGQVLEIASAAGCGRTTALLQIAASCILPGPFQGIDYGGQAAHVLFFDLDGKMDTAKLLELLDARISQRQTAAGVPPEQQDEQPPMQDSLARFHLVRCHSSYELLASLHTLRPTLDALAAAPGGLACLLIDNVAAFHYLDKAARGAPAGGGGGGAFGGDGAPEDITREGAPLTLYRVHAAIAAELRAIQRRFRVPVIASKHVLFPGGREAAGQAQDPWAHRDSMMKPWQELVTHRLMLRAEPGSSGGGGGRGAAHAAVAGQGSPPVCLAKWVLPDDAVVMRFGLEPGGISLLQRLVVVDEVFEGWSDERELAQLERWLLPDDEAEDDMPPTHGADTQGRAPPLASPPERSCGCRRLPTPPVRCVPCTPPLASVTASASPFAWTASSKRVTTRRQAAPLAAAPAAAQPAVASSDAGVLGWLQGWGRLAEELGCAASSSTAPTSSLGCATSPPDRLLVDASMRLSCNLPPAPRTAPRLQGSGCCGSQCSCNGSCACCSATPGPCCCKKRKRVSSEPRAASVRPRAADWGMVTALPQHGLAQLAPAQNPLWLL